MVFKGAHSASQSHFGGLWRALSTLALALLATISLVTLSSSASAAPSLERPSPSTPTGAPPAGLNAGDRIEFTNGRSVVLPKAWEDMTEGDMAAIGIRPGMDYSTRTPRPSDRYTISGAEAPDFTTMDASGCNQQVCIYLYSENGSGPTIIQWDGVAVNFENRYVCTYGAFWVAGKVDGTTPTVCGSYDQFWAGSPNNLPRTFRDGTVLCNTFLHFSGKPCKTVKA